MTPLVLYRKRRGAKGRDLPKRKGLRARRHSPLDTGSRHSVEEKLALHTAVGVGRTVKAKGDG